MSNDYQATYSPEDNKLRLYIGRVPREEYDKLRAEGWVTLHKQREAGGGDFAAVWTPQRRDTALAYAGVILDEDMGPDERAADRAERFSGYRDKRTNDATGHADRYDSGPTAHGYQSQDRAERAAARHDRIADRATDAWSKADYWQRRTAGVIAHALYKSTPGVRMGRVKIIEADLRKQRASLDQYAALWSDMLKIQAMTDPEKQTKAALHYTGSRHVWAEYMHPRAGELAAKILASGTDNAENRAPYWAEHKHSLYTLLSNEFDPITGAEACALFFSDHREPRQETSWTTHLTLRLAYENQMLEAQGGRLAHVEIVPGGRIGGKLIVKVCKSTATGRVTSVFLKGPKVEGWQYRTRNVPGADYSLHQFETERMSPEHYTPPTEADLAELATLKAETKAKAPKKPVCPLINPTDEDAERLQKLWNERAQAEHEKGNTYRSADARKMHSDQFKPSEVCRITQATYSANSKGSYAKAATSDIEAGGNIVEGYYRREKVGKPICQVRTTPGDYSGARPARRVIVITDKPQKPLPAAIWETPAPAEPETKTIRGTSNGLSYHVNA